MTDLVERILTAATVGQSSIQVGKVLPRARRILERIGYKIEYVTDRGFDQVVINWGQNV